MRKIKASAVKNICKFPSTKSFTGPSHLAFKMVLVESLLERDFCFHLEFDQNVEKYFTQPRTYILQSQYLRDRKYTPDFEVHYKNGRKAFIEVKKDIASLDEVYLHKLELAYEEMRSEGYDFVFVQEDQIRAQPLLSNLMRLQRYRGEKNSIEGPLSTLKKKIPNPESLRDLIQNPFGIQVSVIYSLIALGNLNVDIKHNKLSLDMEVCYA